MEDKFFNEFFNKLEDEIDNERFLLDLKTLIENRKLTQTQYKKLIKANLK